MKGTGEERGEMREDDATNHLVTGGCRICINMGVQGQPPVLLLDVSHYLGLEGEERLAELSCL